jgi:hypothetical protein
MSGRISPPRAWDSLVPNKKDRAEGIPARSKVSSRFRSAIQSTAAYSLPVVWRFYKAWITNFGPPERIVRNEICLTSRFPLATFATDGLSPLPGPGPSLRGGPVKG